MLTIIWEKFICYWLDILKIKAFFTAIKIFWLDILIIWDNINRHWFWFDSVKTQDKEYSYCIWDDINKDGFWWDLNFLYLISWIETLYTWFWFKIEDLRLTVSRMEKEHNRREDMLRQEISDLQRVSYFHSIPIKKDDKTHCQKLELNHFHNMYMIHVMLFKDVQWHIACICEGKFLGDSVEY